MSNSDGSTLGVRPARPGGTAGQPFDVTPQRREHELGVHTELLPHLAPIDTIAIRLRLSVASAMV